MDVWIVLSIQHCLCECRCIQNPASNQHSMSVYLVEPKTCQYKLVVSTVFHACAD